MIPNWFMEIIEHLKTQEMCEFVVGIDAMSLRYVPDQFKTQGMCNEAVGERP